MKNWSRRGYRFESQTFQVDFGPLWLFIGLITPQGIYLQIKASSECTKISFCLNPPLNFRGGVSHCASPLTLFKVSWDRHPYFSDFHVIQLQQPCFLPHDFWLVNYRIYVVFSVVFTNTDWPVIFVFQPCPYPIIQIDHNDGFVKQE